MRNIYIYTPAFLIQNPMNRSKSFLRLRSTILHLLGLGFYWQQFLYELLSNS